MTTQRYVIGDPVTGEIVRETRCDADQVNAQTADGSVIAQHDDATAATHYFDAGVLTAYEPEVAALKAQRPEYAVAWNNTLMLWPDYRALEIARAEKREEIKAAREAATVAPLLETPFGVFDADEKGMRNVEKVLAGLREAEALGMAPATITWTLADNTPAEITPAQLGLVAALLLQRGQVAFEKGRVLLTSLNLANDLEGVAAINWNTP